jgi:hypothetical protein
MDTTVPQTIIRQADEGERFWFAGGGTFTMKATAAQTNGSVTLFEDHMLRGKTTPLHQHRHLRGGDLRPRGRDPRPYRWRRAQSRYRRRRALSARRPARLPRHLRHRAHPRDRHAGRRRALLPRLQRPHHHPRRRQPPTGLRAPTRRRRAIRAHRAPRTATVRPRLKDSPQLPLRRAHLRGTAKTHQLCAASRAPASLGRARASAPRR